MNKIPVFIHNPKAASTSIRSVLTVKTAKLGVGSPYRHIHQPIDTRYVQRQIPNAFDKAKIPWLFGVVRHPMDRLVSAWAYFRAPRGRAVPENYVLEAMLQGGDLDDFIRCVDFEKISKHIPHFRTQCQYLIPQKKASIKADQILRFEDLDKDFATLCQNLGIKGRSLPKKRTSKHFDWNSYELSKGSLDKVMGFYGVDFEKFGYDEPSK